MPCHYTIVQTNPKAELLDVGFVFNSIFLIWMLVFLCNMSEQIYQTGQPDTVCGSKMNGTSEDDDVLELC